jgi:hypothetical protein
MSNPSPILHPDIQRLQREIAVLREELVERLAELHDLEHILKPNLLAIFQTKLGPWELQLLEARSEEARLKRKCELIQSAMNRGNPPDLPGIEKALDHEFLTWKQRISETAQKIESARFRLTHLLSREDDLLLKKLFHALAKKLHPDVNPNLSPEQHSLWLRVLQAYEHSDLEKLQALDLAQTDPTNNQVGQGTNALDAERERLVARLRAILEKVAEVKKQPPFSMRAHLEDDAWVESRRAELEAALAVVRGNVAGFLKHLEFLLTVYGTGQKPGLN